VKKMISIRLSEDTLAAIEDMAQVNGISKTSVINNSIIAAYAQQRGGIAIVVSKVAYDGLKKVAAANLKNVDALIDGIGKGEYSVAGTGTILISTQAVISEN